MATPLGTSSVTAGTWMVPSAVRSYVFLPAGRRMKRVTENSGAASAPTTRAAPASPQVPAVHTPLAPHASALPHTVPSGLGAVVQPAVGSQIPSWHEVPAQ